MNKKTRYLLLVIAFSGLLVLMTRIFFLDIMIVQGQSMEPAITQGQLLFVNRLAYGLLEPFSNTYLVRWGNPGKDDVVVFKSPINESITVKRCLAVAGDTFKIQDGYIFIENRKIPLKKYQEKRLLYYRKVPENTIFVLGDNVTNSVDSRDLGFIALDLIIGQAMFISD